MKISQVFLFSAAVCANAFADGVYTNWYDWRFVPVSRTGVDLSAECRYYSDLSAPVHGPWLTNPTATGMTITWTTRAACGAAIDYREKGEAEFRRKWIARQGAVDYLSKTHTLHLAGLKPATTYEYRLVTMMAQQDYYSTEPFADSDIHAFTTMSPGAATCKAFFSTDVHGSLRLLLDPIIDRGHGADSDLFFLLGDNVEDGMYNDAEYWMTFCFLDDCSRKFAKERPLVAIRGNHDCSGHDASRWAEFMPRPDGNAYYTVRQGPVLFVMLDCFAEWKKRTGANEQFEAYANEMADWLKSLKSTAEWKTATYRVAMCHFGVVDGFCVKWPREWFGEILKDDSPEGRIHLFLCGHTHIHRRKMPGATSDAYVRFRDAKPSPLPAPKTDKAGKAVAAPVFTNDYPFAEIELDIGEAMTVEADAKALKVRSWNWRDAANPTPAYDAIDISPDGKVVAVEEIVKQ